MKRKLGKEREGKDGSGCYRKEVRRSDEKGLRKDGKGWKGCCSRKRREKVKIMGWKRKGQDGKGCRKREKRE